MTQAELTGNTLLRFPASLHRLYEQDRLHFNILCHQESLLNIVTREGMPNHGCYLECHPSTWIGMDCSQMEPIIAECVREHLTQRPLPSDDLRATVVVVMA